MGLKNSIYREVKSPFYTLDLVTMEFRPACVCVSRCGDESHGRQRDADKKEGGVAAALLGTPLTLRPRSPRAGVVPDPCSRDPSHPCGTSSETNF